MATKTCFIMGYPSAGKTTFIAALWQSLKPNSVDTKLQLNKFAGNQAYLTQIGNDWLSGKVFNRTLTNSQNEALSISLVDSQKNEIVFSFSDFSGEMFNNIYVDREINLDLKNEIFNSHSFVLFVSPKTTNDPVNIAALNLGTLCETESETKTDYDKIEHDSTAAKLVELLQIIDYLCQRKNMKFSVVVSAWDTIGARFLLPQEYIKECLPLLWQYLKSNSDIFNAKYYGVSAQGVELHDVTLTEDENAQNVDLVLEQYENNPVERIRVVDQFGNVSHDITLPLWELICGEKEV